MAKFTIDAEKKRFVVDCSGNFEEGSVIMKLPSRRWMQARRVFIVPMNKLNYKAMLEAVAAKKLTVPPEVMKLIRKGAQDKSGDRPFPEWYSFKRKPRPVQRDGIAKVYKNDVGALFAKMGRGKSKMAIDVLTAHFYERRIQLVINIMPKSVTAVWGGPDGELAKDSPIDFEYVYVDSSFEWTRLRVRQDKLIWLLVGIESLSQGHTIDRLLPVVEHYKVGLLVDEASRIKNHATIRTENVKMLGVKSEVRLIATGTPNPKSLIDLYSLFDFLDPNIIGSSNFYSFRNRYCIMGGYKNKQIVAYDNTDELMRLIEPYTYTIGKDPNLPKQLWQVRYTQLTDDQKEVYRQIKKAEIRGVTVSNVLARVLRLQQVVGGFYSLDPVKTKNPLTGKVRSIKGDEVHFMDGTRNPKILEIQELLGEHDGSPIIIWAKFVKEIDDLEKVMSSLGRTWRLHRDQTIEERIILKDRFQNGEFDFLVGSTQLGGLGLTLTRSHTTFYYSNTNDGEQRMQSEDRTHRDGQTDPCNYVDFLAKGTVDEPLYASNIEKKNLDDWTREKLLSIGRDPHDPVEIFRFLSGDIE